MPKLEPKLVQKELESGVLWPVYWLYGGERMKSRELLKRIRAKVLGEDHAATGLGFAEEVLEGSEVDAPRILDSVQSLTLGGGLRFVVVRDAHLVKEPEQLASLLGPSAPKEKLTSVTVFLSKDLDGRKKFSKLLLEKAAVVPCEDIPEEEREAWIGYLAKRRGLALAPELGARLRSMDPWNLDIVDQELGKYALAFETSQTAGETPEGAATMAADVLLGSVGSGKGTDDFLNAFFSRDAQALEILDSFVDSPDESLPLLGLLSWNVRFLAQVVADQERRTRNTKLSPFLADRLGKWARAWKLDEVVQLQSALADLDYEMKQTARLPVGLWSSVVSRFCHRR